MQYTQVSTKQRTYYVSLCKGLDGYYVKFTADNEEAVRSYITEYFGLLWQDIYTEAYFMEILRRRDRSRTRIVNRQNPIVLEGAK